MASNKIFDRNITQYNPDQSNFGMDDATLTQDDFLGGGAGGIITPSPIEKPLDSIYIRVVGGCTDRGARNFNASATYDDGSCVYNPPSLPVVLDYDAPVRINVLLENISAGTATVVVDGVEVSNTPHILDFTEKSLLSPRIISVKKAGYSSMEEYRVKTVYKSIKKEIKPLVSLSDRIPTSDTSNQNILIDSKLPPGVRSDFSQIGTMGIPGRNDIQLNNNGYLGYTSPVSSPSTQQTSLVVGFTTFNYYELQIEKKIDGVFVAQPPLNSTPITDISIRSRLIAFNLSFNLTPLNSSGGSVGGTDDSIKTTEVGTSNTSIYKIRIIGEVPSDNSVGWRTNYGQTGFVLNEDDIVTFEIEQQRTFEIPYIEFFGNGITDFTNTAAYEYQVDSKNVSSRKGIFQKFELRPGTNDFSVSVTKNVNTPSPQTPNIKVDRNSGVFNISNPTPISISYSSIYSDNVIFSLGNTKRTLNPSGTITLTESDFSRGLGQYTLYLQPVSETAGSGDVQKIVITVESKAYLPGPDITHINYPQNIKGRDFTEYDVPFEISWQSVNTNYIHVYVGKVSDSTFLGKFSNAGSAEFKVSDVLRKAGERLDENRNLTTFNLILVPWNIEGDEATEGKYEEINITFDKGDLKVRRANVVRDILNSFKSELNTSGFDEYTSPFLTHFLHLGNGSNKLIGTWGIDDVTFSEQYRDGNNQIQYKNIEKSIVLKLYEPLPRTISNNDTVWISKIQSIPIIDQITLLDEVVSNCTPLRPNFDLDLSDDIGYQILDDLISSGSTTSTDLVNQFISSSGLSLDNLELEFVTQSAYTLTYDGYDGDVVLNGSIIEKVGDPEWNWKSFVKYSSAAERVSNFYYKVQLIEIYQSKYNLLTSGSGDTEWTGSLSVLNEANKNLLKIKEVQNGFDSFEKWLYVSSSESGLTYPKQNNTGSLVNSNDSQTLSWLNSILYSAQEYDELNTSRLTYNLPQHIKNDENNSEFILFFDMVGQHFDILWNHIKSISNTKNIENKKDVGIVNDLVYHMLESLGWDADMGVKSQFLWEYAFGKHSDGTQVSSMSGKDRQQEIWRRILNNLPYLYKHKGTKRALHAALSCYGIPASLLTVMEFGGPQDPQLNGTTKFTFEDRTASINISGSSAILIPWKQFTNDISTDYPNSVEIRLNTDQRQDQEIISGSEWSLHLLKDTGSMAHFELRVSGSGTLYSASSDSGSFFNDGYTQVVVNKERIAGSDVFTFYGKEGFQERLRTNVSGSLTISGVSGWTSGSEIKIGGNTLTASVDEFRLWRTALSESRIDNHTLLPDAIDGNHISASTHDLILRHDFEYPKNRGVDTDIKNVALVTTYCTGSEAVGFESISSYPYQYTPYDRTVTANVPSTGFNFSNKVRFETQTKITDLSYKTRATKKSFDQSPIDSNKLGLFFSPIKEINMDILKSLGSFNIDNYIGNPSDEYSNEYRDLRTLRNYYFDRYTLNIYEYIQLVRYIDKSLFDVLESLVPARAKVSSGLLIEPHILERSKTEWKRPSGEKNDYAATINVEEDVNVTSTNDQYNMVVDASLNSELSGENPQYDTTIITQDDINLTGTRDDYSTIINTENDINLYGEITRNSGSDMGGISITIDAKFTGSIQGQYDSTAYQQIGMDPDSVSVLGFGLYGSGSHSIRTRLINNNFVKDRVKVYLLKESSTELVPTISGSDGGSYYRLSISENEEVVKYQNKVTILPFNASDPVVGGNIVEVTPLNGYFPSHYRNVGDLTSGMENSFFNGSKQTSATTLDGSSPVQTFTTNPNTLRVSDTGRGSGEPILEVD